MSQKDDNMVVDEEDWDKESQKDPYSTDSGSNYLPSDDERKQKRAEKIEKAKSEAKKPEKTRLKGKKEKKRDSNGAKKNKKKMDVTEDKKIKSNWQHL